MSDMPVGPCCICDEQLDHTDAGFCSDCGGQPFCWSSCGGWSHMKHTCNECMEDE